MGRCKERFLIRDLGVECDGDRVSVPFLIYRSLVKERKVVLISEVKDVPMGAQLFPFAVPVWIERSPERWEVLLFVGMDEGRSYAVRGLVGIKDERGEVMLDVYISPELREEGEYRELVHRLQRLRKRARFAVTDRIEVFYEGEIANIFRKWAPEISEAVLATSVREGRPGAYEATLEFGTERKGLASPIYGKRGRVWLRRVS